MNNQPVTRTVEANNTDEVKRSIDVMLADDAIRIVITRNDNGTYSVTVTFAE